MPQPSAPPASTRPIEDPTPEGSLLAAIDLGSHSFHLIIARLVHGKLAPIETIGEKVRLGAGLNQGKLSEDAIERGLACLSRFANLLSDMEPRRLRVVGTNALRQAKNRRVFTDAAERILNAPIDVVYGREEARLVYLGVAHTLADDKNNRLVIDIGGGSTEIILGQRLEPLRLESVQIGCVSYATDHFSTGVLSKKSYQGAYDRALLEISHIKQQFCAHPWAEAVGSSGTLQAIETLIVAAGWASQGIDRRSLEKLRQQLLRFDTMDDIALPGLNDSRRQVIVSGLAITQAVFDGLAIDHMRIANGALREGVLYDLVGRLCHEDVRERTVGALLARYCADQTNAIIVGNRVRWLAEQVAQVWDLTDDAIALLQWAGQCHEIGLTISKKHYNRHSAYLLENSDLPGFSQREQVIMATLVRAQRGKMTAGLFSDLPKASHPKLKRMIALLRIAIIFKYVDILEELANFIIEADSHRLQLSLTQAWQDSHPLTVWELQQAIPALAKLNVDLDLSTKCG